MNALQDTVKSMKTIHGSEVPQVLHGRERDA